MRQKWPVVSELEVAGKAVLVRGDLDVDDLDNPRFNSVREMVRWLNSQMASRVKVIGHGGNIGMVTELGCDVNWDLRADEREKSNDELYARELAIGFDVYINEAFATSHRLHASIVALPKYMKSQGKQVAIGIRFARELEMMDQVRENDEKKLLVVGGTKVEDKNRYAADLEKQGWIVLRGGKLAGAKLRPDGLDVDPDEIVRFENEIAKAKFIVGAGVMGKYEEVESEEGTRRILTAISNSGAYKIAGGGDIESAISKYGLSEKFDWISVGGGAMLEYITAGTLVGLEALA